MTWKLRMLDAFAHLLLVAGLALLCLGVNWLVSGVEIFWRGAWCLVGGISLPIYFLLAKMWWFDLLPEDVRTAKEARLKEGSLSKDECLFGGRGFTPEEAEEWEKHKKLIGLP